MEIYQRAVGSKVVIGGVNAKVGIGNSRMRHIDEVNNLLKVRRRMVGVDVVNDGNWMGGKKSKTHYIFNQGNQQIT